MKLFETILEKIFLFSSVASASVTLLIFGFMVILGIPLFQEGNFFNLLIQGWSPHYGLYGIYPMMVGTMMIAGLSVLFAFPLSLGTACFVSILGPRSIARFLKNVVRLMTGIPTVIYGFVGVFLLVPVVREVFQSGSGMCILSGAMMLALLISPTMILFFTESFESVPESYLNAVDALGGTKVQKLLYVILPLSRKGIFTGVILATGRAVGDTLIALMLAGNAIQIPDSLFDSARTLTAHIALVIAADYESLEFKSLFTCGIILYTFTALMVVGIRLLEYRKKN